MQETWRRFKLTGDTGARDELIESHVHLVKYVLGRMLNLSQMGTEALDFDDLYSSGVMGLIKAVDDFDISREVKFITYAIPRIRGAIIDELRHQDPLPRTMRGEVQRLEEALGRLEMDKQRPASDDELCRELEVSPDKLDQIFSALEYAIHVSLDEEVSVGDEGIISKRELVKDDTDVTPRTDAQRSELIEGVADAIDALPEKERLVIILYYTEELTLKEIGEVLDVTESRVCQLHSKAVGRLRARLRTMQLHPAS